MLIRASTLIAFAGVVTFSGCNCGRQPVVMKTEASLSLPVEVLDFGVVPEGTSKGAKFRVDNVGRAPVNVTVAFVAGGSSDFTLGAVPAQVDASGFIEVPVIFTPTGAGSDEAFVELEADVGDEPPLRVLVKGGPIFPALTFDPDPLSFAPATMSLERKTALLKSTGTAGLTVRSVGVAANGNPDFSVVPPALPVRLLPGESVGVRVEYARSARRTEGLMEVLSDDADAGLKRLRLLPDPPSVCSNLVDDDNDGLIDYPNDPGCQDATDNDEYNPAQCVTGAVQPCGAQDGGYCAGTRSCTSGLWGMCFDAGTPIVEVCNNVDDDCDGQIDDGVSRACYRFAAGTRGVGNCRDGLETCSLGMFTGNCVGQVGPSTELCGDAIDEDCDGVVNNGCDGGVVIVDAGVDAGVPDAGLDAGVVDAGVADAGACSPVGVWRIDGGAIQLQCCNIIPALNYYAVNLNVNQFNISPATSARGQPTQPGNILQSSATPSCPAGSFTYTRSVVGDCTETYTLTGTFTSANRFEGTYTATFSGPQCVGDALCNNEDCLDQSWPIEAYR
jgi:hypothetical protein